MIHTTNYLNWTVDHGRYAEAKDLLMRLNQLREALPQETVALRRVLTSEVNLLYQTVQIEQAIEIVEKVYQSSHAEQDLQQIIVCDTWLALILLQRKDYGRLKIVLEEGLELEQRIPIGAEPFLLSMKVALLCRAGQVAEAARSLDEFSREKPYLADIQQHQFVGLATAEVAMARQEWERAWAAFESVVEGWRSKDMPF
jgi:tetratricopeptide (TPR) repeat protein